VPDITCPSCGLTFAQFQSTGRFGCAEDYDAFVEHIAPRLERFHDASQHTGKVPRAGNAARRRSSRARALRSQLRDAVAQEAYEQAARLRDEIQKVEELEGSSEE
jgi:protein arginine kinase activator